MPVSFLSPLSGNRLPSLPSRLSKGKRLCFSTRVPLYICTQLIKYFHFAPFPSGNRCLTAKLFCLTRAATDYTCWLQTQGLFFSPFFFFLFENRIPLKKKKTISALPRRALRFASCPHEQPYVQICLWHQTSRGDASLQVVCLDCFSHMSLI